MDNLPKSAGSPLLHRIIMAAGFVVVAWFYAWTNDPTAASWRIHGEQTDYYNVLIHGFLKGHLYMDAPVAPELIACPDPWNPAVRGPNIPILQDATYYQGRYYLYYGPAPLVTLMLPFRLITGADLPLSLATVCFAWGGLLASLILWESIRQRYFPEVGAWVGLAAVFIIGVANPLPVLLRRTLVYELPIASGFCFSMAALLALYWSIHSARFRNAWLVAASICLGLAVASRLTFLFTMPVLLIPAWLAWREQGERKLSNLPWRPLFAAVAPITAIGALMALYNYQRFGQLTEFGTKYQVAEMFDLMNPRRFALDYVPFNIVDYLFATPDLSRHFPYVYFPGNWHSPIPAPAGYWGPELVPGMLACFPICALAVLAIFAGGQSASPQRGRLRAWLLGLGGLFLGTALCLLCYYAGAVRYMVDFTPPLMLGAALGLLVVEVWLIRQRAAAIRVIGRTTWLALFTVSLAIGLMFSLGVRATFRAVDPVGHARVARFFETLSFWNPRLPHKGGAVEMVVRLEKFAAGQSEPLFSCGAGRDSEAVFLRWSDDAHVVFGYRRGLDTSPQLSAPLAVQLGSVHRVYIDLGSLYAGSSDAVATSGTAARPEYAEMTKRWMILCDDEVVLQGRYRDNEAPRAGNLVFLGCDPNSDDFGKVMRNPIVSTRRLPLADAVARAANRSSIGLEFKAPRDVAEGAQALLTVLGFGREHRVEIEYLGAARAQLRFWRDASEVARSDIFPNNGQWHRLELNQVFAAGKNTIQARIDGSALATIAAGSIDFRSDEVRAGWGTRSSAPFTGFLRHAYANGAQPVRFSPRGSRTALSVIFPRQHTGASEPLLVTGRNGAGDFYEAVYLDEDHVSIRHDHWGAGIVRTSRPIKMDPGVPHRIMFDFAPPNPGDTSPRAAANGALRITLDGQAVWEEDTSYHSFGENEFYIGRNDIGGSTCAREFSGEILSCDTNAAPR